MIYAIALDNSLGSLVGLFVLEPQRWEEAHAESEEQAKRNAEAPDSLGLVAPDLGGLRRESDEAKLLSAGV